MEKKLTDAMSRRSYLVDSIADFNDRIERKSLQSLIAPDAVQRSSEYYKTFDEQRKVKMRIESVVEEYKSRMLWYDEARRKFDESADQAKHSHPFSYEDQVKISQLSLDVLAAQRTRDATEAEYIAILRDFDASLAHTASLRKSIGETIINEAAQYFEMIRNVQEQVDAEDLTVASLRSQIELTKNRYKGAMLRLEEVSNGLRTIMSSEAGDND